MIKKILLFFMLGITWNNIAQGIPNYYTPNPVNNSNWAFFWTNSPISQSQLLSDSDSGASYQVGLVPELSNFNFLTREETITELSNYGCSNTNDDDLMPNISYTYRIGGDITDTSISDGSEEMRTYIPITPNDEYFSFTVKILTRNRPNEISISPFFKANIKIIYNDSTEIDVFNHIVDETSNTAINCFSFEYLNDILRGNINLSEININYCKNPKMYVSFMVSDGVDIENNSIGVCAYLYKMNISKFFPVDSLGEIKLCSNVEYPFLLPTFGYDVTIVNHQWSIRKEQTNINTVVLPQGINSYAFPENGVYTLILNVTLNYPGNQNCTFNPPIEFEYITVGNDCREVDNPPEIAEVCASCSSFAPLKGEKYIVGGWVKMMEDMGNSHGRIISLGYEGTHIEVVFRDYSGYDIGTEMQIYPIGEIIDGWQKIQGEFVVPLNTKEILISLVNENSNGIDAFFDDIRVHPYNSNLKSFVYDQATQKLMAELDENNYATFYEYDKEGGLVRVKKETEKGIFTIQETRSSTPKKD